MTSQRQVCFLRLDERAFGTALRDKFPGILLWDGQYYQPALPLRQNIDESPALKIKAALPDAGWEPTFEKVKNAEIWRLRNSPECCLTLVRGSTHAAVRSGERDDDLGYIEASSLQVHVDPPASQRQMSFRNKVWRIVGKLATHRWQIVDLITDEVRHRNQTSKQLWLGHHAVEWAGHPLWFFAAGSRAEQIRPLEDAD